MAQMQINGSPIKMVFFDAGGTLFDVVEPVGKTYATLAQRFDKKVEPEVLQRNFLTAFKRMPPLAFAGNLSQKDLSSSEYQWWRRLVYEVFVASGEFRYFEEFFAEAYAHYAHTKAWKLFDDVLPTLEVLQSQSIKIGVISNFDSRLMGLLEGFGVKKYFNSIHFSSRVGFAKPHPKIFQAALRDNEIIASAAVHIGDNPVQDVQAATNAGLSAWLIKRHRKECGLSSFLESLGVS